jgi:hypothetical protein
MALKPGDMVLVTKLDRHRSMRELLELIGRIGKAVHRSAASATRCTNCRKQKDRLRLQQ